MAWGGARRKISDDMKQEIVSAYLRDKMPIENLAVLFGISRTACFEIISVLEEYEPIKPRQYKKGKVLVV
jgi:transposase-like protein